MYLCICIFTYKYMNIYAYTNVFLYAKVHSYYVVQFFPLFEEIEFSGF